VGGEESKERPKNWRKILETQIRNCEGDVSPEYSTPELELEGAYKDVLLGRVAELEGDSRGKQLNVFYDYIADCIGSEGKNMVAVDPADKALFAIYDLGLSPVTFELMKKAGLIHSEARFTNKLREIESWERWTMTSNDARHLVIARGLMQHALMTGKSVLHINAPFHAERVYDYIQRQKDFENSSSKLEKLMNGPAAEIIKMMDYKKMGLSLAVKAYAPLLRKEAYEMNKGLSETWASLGEESLSSKILSDLSEVERLYGNYLKSYMVIDTNAGHDFCNNIAVSLEKIDKLKKEIGDSYDIDQEIINEIKIIKKLVSTMIFWTRTSKKPIY
jgi:hypothetical protein